MRLTLGHVTASRLPRVSGLCVDDTPGIAAIVNEATQRLLFAGGETGWWGNWQKVLFQVTRSSPYITLPRQLARVINLDVCERPITMRNEFWEFLPGGPSLKTALTSNEWCGSLGGYERPSVPTMVDLTTTNQLLRVYISDSRDVSARILIKGTDQNGLGIYSQDGLNPVDGFYISFDFPFTTTSFVVSSIAGIEKDKTFGDVVLKQVDQTTGTEATLSRYAPDETNPSYRRYMLAALPLNCCSDPDSPTVQITALGKLEFLPVSRLTDFLIISNIPALIEEAQALRYSEMDNPNAAVLELKHHRRAIRLLQDEQRHYLGEQHPAVSVDIMQGASMDREGIGVLI